MRQPADELAALKQAGLRREIRQADHTLVDFSSNDYLGLANHPALAEAAISAIKNYGSGSKSARLISGTHNPHLELEEKLAAAKGKEAALVFSTGYATALGTLSSLAGKDDTLILDKLCHASLIDGARLSGATIRVFPHNHLEKLERLLKSNQPTAESRTIVITEAVFSMDGDRSPLRAIVKLKEQYGAWLLVDEAHSFGLLGDTGMGLGEELGLTDDIDLHMGTLSKAAGSAGGYITATRNIVDLILNSARSFIYSTAPMPAQAAAASAALDVICSPEGKALRRALCENISLFSTITGSHQDSAIHPIHIGENKEALKRAEQLRAFGFQVPAIRYPTVPRKTARLRVSLSAAHSAEQIHELSKVLQPPM